MSPIGKLLIELFKAAEEGIEQPPEWYLGKAQLLAAMWMEVKEEKTKFEMAYKKEIVALIDSGQSVASATLKIEAISENYRLYLYCKGRDEQIEQIILLAKKRASLRDSY